MNVLGADPQILRDLDSKVRANLSTYQQRLRAEVVTVSSDGKKARVKLPGETPPYQRPMYPVQGRVAVGDSVWVLLDNGGLIIIAMDRFIADTDTSITNVKAGGLNDFSLVNSKYASDSQDSRSIASSAVGNAELAFNAVDSNRVASDSLIPTADFQARGISTNEIGFGQVATGEVTDFGLGGTDIGAAEIGDAHMVALTLTNNSMASGAVGNRIIAFQSILGSNVSTDAIGTRELNGSDSYLNTSGHTHSSTVFIRYPKEQRLKWLELRRALKEREGIGKEPTPENFAKLLEQFDLVAENLLAALQLHYDYKTLDADTREEMFDADPEWLAYYDEEYYVGRWEGYEPMRILSASEQEHRQTKEIKDGWELQHAHLKRLPW